MSVEDTRKRVPIGSFFARLGRRVRSKSPAVSRLSSETRKTCKSHGVHSGADGCANEVDCADLCHSPHLFGSFIHKLSRRKSKKSGGKLDGHFSKDESHTLPHDIGKTIQQAKLSTPRSAMSENDLRHVTVCRGTDVAVTPITGVSQFVSEDNLAVAECGTPAYRVPSYIRVSCALNGYTKSPRHLESSATRSLGSSLVERRLGMFESMSPDRRELLNQIGKESPGDQTMGTFFSTPVRALIGQFDRLQLCSKDKENAAESCEPVRSFVTKQPTPPTLGSHSAEKSAKSERILDDVNKRSSGPPTIIGLIRDVPVMRTDMRTGEDFDRLLESVRSRLQASIAQVLSELEEVESMPEEAESSIRIAAGKAQLLVRNKLSKFEELVKKHLSPSKGDPQPATVDDLEGYWALVEIELHDIDECFKKVDAWRASGWNLVESAEAQTFVLSPNNNKVIKKKKKMPSSQIGTAVYDDNSPNLTKQSEKQKVAAVMRKKALAEAKQKLRETQQTRKDTNDSPCSDALMVL